VQDLEVPFGSDGSGEEPVPGISANMRIVLLDVTFRREAAPVSQIPLDTPESIPAAFARAWNARDPDALASLFDEDADFVNVVGLWWRDREAIRRAHAYGLTRIFHDSTLRVGAVTVKRMSDDIAVVHARMHLDGQAPIAGIAHPGTRHTIFAFVVHRTAAGWRCASAQNTDVVPGAESNVIDGAGRLVAVDYRSGDPTRRD